MSLEKGLWRWNKTSEVDVRRTKKQLLHPYIKSWKTNIWINLSKLKRKIVNRWCNWNKNIKDSLMKLRDKRKGKLKECRRRLKDKRKHLKRMQCMGFVEGRSKKNQEGINALATQRYQDNKAFYYPYRSNMAKIIFFHVK